VRSLSCERNKHQSERPFIVYLNVAAADEHYVEVCETIALLAMVRRRKLQPTAAHYTT
jgi:hypothetical protein